MAEEEERSCSFCGRTQKEAPYLIAASTGACICDECLVAAIVMIADHRQIKPERVYHLLLLGMVKTALH